MSFGFEAAHRGGSGSPLVLIHGFVDTWRTWGLVLERLEAEHDVLAPTLAGHAGGPPLTDPVTSDTLADALEQAMDDAGFETAHIAGNSLGGYLALQLAQRGRARSVVALAPGGGWADGDDSYRQTLAHFTTLHAQLRTAVGLIDGIVATSAGRRRATRFIATNFAHIPRGLIAHQMRGAAACDGVPALVDLGLREGWPLRPEDITCPVRIIWGADDALLPWPRAAQRFRKELPAADWVVLDGVGHCPQLDVPLEAAQLILGFTA